MAVFSADEKSLLEGHDSDDVSGVEGITIMSQKTLANLSKVSLLRHLRRLMAFAQEQGQRASLLSAKYEALQKEVEKHRYDYPRMLYAKSGAYKTVNSAKAEHAAVLKGWSGVPTVRALERLAEIQPNLAPGCNTDKHRIMNLSDENTFLKTQLHELSFRLKASMELEQKRSAAEAAYLRKRSECECSQQVETSIAPLVASVRQPEQRKRHWPFWRFGNGWANSD